MEERKRLIAEIHAFLVKAAIMAVTLWVIFGVVFGVMPMKDQSMMPKLAAGDLLLYYRLDRTPGDREVVVFEKEGKTYVGRVVARGGDTVEIREDALLQINGNAIVENGVSIIRQNHMRRGSSILSHLLMRKCLSCVIIGKAQKTAGISDR